MMAEQSTVGLEQDIIEEIMTEESYSTSKESVNATGNGKNILTPHGMKSDANLRPN
jgi:hypothetical protein